MNHTISRLVLLVFGTAGVMFAQNSATSVSVDANANRHPISPNIYGLAYADAQDMAFYNASLNRWGGNGTSRYNWQIDAHSAGADWYFETYSDGNGSGAPSGSADTWVATTRSANNGAEPLFTIPMIDYLANLGPNRSTLEGFSVAKYGAQAKTDPWNSDAGNGVSAATGKNITGNNPLDSGVANTPAIEQAWVQHFVSKYGPATSATGIKYYILDNEVSLWFSTHRDVHPQPPTYQEIFNKVVEYATAIRAADPSAKIAGFEEWGFSAMYLSGFDQANGVGAASSDYNTHNQTYYYPWLLQQVQAYKQQTGVQLLDYLTIHGYNQVPDGSDDSLSGQLLRNKETRILWDPTFKDSAWWGNIGLNGGIIAYIPTLKAWINQYCPGLKIGITEYSWGDDPNLNGATTLADVLGIYGREGVDLATRWGLSNDTSTTPATYYVTALASRIYRNYDGLNSGFGDTSVAATVANPDNLSAFAAVRSSDGALTVIVINKQQGGTPVTVNIADFIASGNVQVWQINSASQTAIARLTDVMAANNTIVTTVPSQSITLFVVPVGTPQSPSVTTPPAAQTVTIGQAATFSVAVTAIPAPTYQWQQQVAGSSTWTNLSDNSTFSGAATATLTVSSATAAMNGSAYRCVVANTIGTTTSADATMVVDSPMSVVTLAGLGGTNGSADGTGSAARFDLPADVALDSAGNVYVADTANNTIREISPAGAVTTVAGQAGLSGSSDGSSSARFNHPTGIAVDAAGNLYVADTNNDTIRKVTSAGSVTTLAGQAGTAGSADGIGTAASFSGPSGIAVDSSGVVYVADTLNHTIRQITPAGVVTTIAGTAGASGATDATGSDARFYGPQGLVLGGAGNLFIADTNNNAIRKLATASGIVTTVAGLSGVAGSADGANSQATFHYPSAVGLDSSGNLYVVDTDNHTIREMVSSGAVSTLAGLAGTSGSADGVGTAARFNFPTGLAVDSAGDVYVADSNNHAIRLCVYPVAPAVTVQPQSQTVGVGSSASFSVTATGKPAPTYQWLFNGNAIAGANASSYSLSNVQTANAGNYAVTVTNLAGNVTSSAATLTVSTPTTTIPQGGGGGGGGGGAPSWWFDGALVVLAVVARRRRLRPCGRVRLYDGDPSKTLR
jgi:hypothetical protein